jgi:hypothetical protein
MEVSRMEMRRNGGLVAAESDEGRMERHHWKEAERTRKVNFTSTK